ncbi:MAG: T9SS type A sorting domain-containing protein [Muribaculaceae bacterium]
MPDGEIIPEEGVTVQAFNLLGQPVTGTLSSGIYIVKAATAGKTAVKKISIR